MAVVMPVVVCFLNRNTETPSRRPQLNGTYVIWAIVFLALIGPKLIRGETMRPTDALLLFAVMVLEVCLAG